MLANVLPGGASLPALLAVAFLAAALANLVNNLPAVLALLPIGAFAVMCVWVFKKYRQEREADPR